jgi:hypothetical protein
VIDNELLVPGGEFLVPKSSVSRGIDEEGNIYSFGFKRPPKKTDGELEKFLSEHKDEDVSYQKSEATPLDLLHRDMYIKNHFIESNTDLDYVTRGMLGDNIASGFFSVMEKNLPLFQFYSECYPEQLGELHFIANDYLKSFGHSIMKFHRHQNVYMRNPSKFDHFITVMAHHAGGFINSFEKIYGNLNYENINPDKEKESLSGLQVFLHHMRQVSKWTVKLIGYKSYRKEQASYRKTYTHEPKPAPQPSSGGVCTIL